MQAADPVRIGLVDSVNRPGGNVTGINLMAAEMAGKRLDLLLELVPKATLIGYLRNPTNPVFAESEARELEAACSWTSPAVRECKSRKRFRNGFRGDCSAGAHALVVSSAVSLLTDPDQTVALAARHAVPAIYAWRASMAVGGLMSYATNLADTWRQTGVYTGRILTGEKPADLPVQRVTKIELVINLKTAKTLGVNVPLGLSAGADDVIE
jgi:putative tryptophan/tyrosine transport system substrate-binding protein